MKKATLFLVTLLLAGSALAQNENKPPEGTKFYKLDFVIKELEAGKVTSTRSFVMSIGQVGPFNSGSVRTGDKVAVPTGSFGGGNTQYTYVDLGVNIDCRLQGVVDNQLLITITADISSLASQGSPPVVAQTKWNSGATVPLRKPTVLFSADGAASKRQIQLEVTATPIQ
jgi:hypothetical protein